MDTPGVQRPPLACPVRGCALPLDRRDRVWACASGHVFDIARSGYVNLLQPQDRKSREPGDARRAVEARAALLAAGIGRVLIDEVIRHVVGSGLPPGAVVVDLGSGTGDALGALADAQAITGVGIDLSVDAAEHAARRFPHLTWVVANADRRLPLLDAGADVVVSLYGRRNPAESARVLKPGGRLVLAVPASDDLVELRAAVQGAAVERDRLEALAAEHTPWFTVRERGTVRERRAVDRAELHALLAATYRGARTSAAAKVEALNRLEVTFSSELLILTAE